MTLLLVALGAAAGAAARYAASALLDARLPWGTALVNLAGSFLVGLFGGLALAGAPAALLGAGFCGGLTTYSSFAVQAVGLPARAAAAYVALTVAPALLLVAAGFWLGAR